MKNPFFLTLFLIFGLMTNLSWSQGSVADTTRRKTAEPPAEKQLPQIQLNEYTIVGLAKVTLPRKIRSRIFKPVKIEWAENREIWKKALPAIAFQFARVKPSLLRLYEFPWFNSRIYYGSFNTLAVNIQSQFCIRRFLPYFSANFLNSNGHTENAQHSFAGLRSGFHYQLKEGQLFRLGTNYRSTKRGIWGRRAAYQTNQETQSTLWSSFANLEQRWSPRFSSVLEGRYFMDDHENVFHYSERGWDGSADAAVQMNKTRLEGTLRMETSALTVGDGNLLQLQSDSTALKKYESTLLSGTLLLQQQIEMLTLQAGVLYQQSDEKTTLNKRIDSERSFTYPRASLSAKLNHRINVTVAYQPHLSISRLRFAVRVLPFSDVGRMHIQRYDSRWQAALNIDFPGETQFGISGNVSRVKDYFAPVAPADSLPAAFNALTTSYPGWTFSTINEIRLTEVKTRFRWEIGARLKLSGMALFRRSEIKKSALISGDLTGKAVPYLPELTAQGALDWKFYRNHQVSLWLNYQGKRYDDLRNQTQLADYLLLSARLRFALSQNVYLFVKGGNLLDSKYEQWRGFSAPGINGFLGLRVIF